MPLKECSVPFVSGGAATATGAAGAATGAAGAATGAAGSTGGGAAGVVLGGRDATAKDKVTYDVRYSHIMTSDKVT